jgi:hypothetical protein
MVKKKIIITKMKSFYDFLNDLGELLPFILFVIMPYLYDKINGFSVIICIMVSIVFIILASNYFISFYSLI